MKWKNSVFALILAVLLTGCGIEALHRGGQQGILRVILGAACHIIVHADKVHGNEPLVQILLVVFGHVLPNSLAIPDHLLRIGALHHRLGPPAKVPILAALRRLIVLLHHTGRHNSGDAVHSADLTAQIHGLVQLDRAEVGDQVVVACQNGLLPVLTDL